MEDGERSIQNLPIRVTRVVSNEGEVARMISTFCPVRGHSLAVADCARCDRCQSITVEDSGRSSCVVCSSKVTPMPDSGPCVADVMTRNTVCVRADLSIAALSALFFEEKIGGAAVVDATGRPIGMVSKTDLLAPRSQADANGGSALTVEEIMTPLAFSVAERSPATFAAALMAHEGVHQLPVLSSAGRVVGVISALDVLGWVARKDGLLLRGQG